MDEDRRLRCSVGRTSRGCSRGSGFAHLEPAGSALIGSSDPWFLGQKKPLFKRPGPVIAIVVTALMIALVVLSALSHSVSRPPSQQFPVSQLSGSQTEWCLNNPGTVNYYARTNGEIYSTAAESDPNYVAACIGAYSQSNP